MIGRGLFCCGEGSLLLGCCLFLFLFLFLFFFLGRSCVLGSMGDYHKALLLLRKNLAKSRPPPKISDEIQRIDEFIPKTSPVSEEVVSFVVEAFLSIWNFIKAVRKKSGDTNRSVWEWAMRAECLLARVSTEKVAVHLVEHLLPWVQETRPCVGVLNSLFVNMHKEFPSRFAIRHKPKHSTTQTTTQHTHTTQHHDTNF